MVVQTTLQDDPLFEAYLASQPVVGGATASEGGCAISPSLRHTLVQASILEIENRFISNHFDFFL